VVTPGRAFCPRIVRPRAATVAYNPTVRLGTGIALGLIGAWLSLGCGSGTDKEPAPDPDPPQGCDAHEIQLGDGSCASVGVPPDGCGEGFVHDGQHGCDVILPEACPSGFMAVPGDSTCRQHACGDGPWGDIVTAATTQFVNAAYAGADSDGSESKPWIVLQDGIDAAAPGATVAVAAGSYDEVTIDAPVVLWGRCASMVEVVSAPGGFGAVFVRNGADGSIVRGLGLVGAVSGVGMSGALDVAFDQLWLHDLPRGIEFNNSLGPAGMAVTDTLFEGIAGIAFLASGASAQIDRVEIRNVTESGGGAGIGRGIVLQSNDGMPAAAVVSRSQVHRCEGEALRTIASLLEVDGTVVHDAAGVSLFAMGIYAEPSAEDDLPTELTVRRSVVERVNTFGIFAAGTTAMVDATVVRDIAPSGPNADFGRGIDIQISSLGTLAHGTITQSLVERVHESGIYAEGASLALSNIVVRQTLPTLDLGIFGDGVVVLPYEGASVQPGSATIDTALLEGHARSNVASFGGAISVTRLRGRCSAFDLATESYAEIAAVLEDGGDNLCGCPEATDPCQATPSMLAPPLSSPDL
jgi:hypothetical protein